jgi:hypothetical protein
MQVQLAAHQPQAAASVQLPQSQLSLHGSAVVQASEYQTQSPHVLPAGPLQLPVWQLEVELHQPQAAVPVQSSQPVAPAHSSVGHSEESQFQSPQEPELGPE